MKWRIQIGAGIRDHLDFADLEFGSGRVVLPRRFPAQVVADDGCGKAFVGYEAVGDGMA